MRLCLQTQWCLCTGQCKGACNTYDLQGHANFFTYGNTINLQREGALYTSLRALSRASVLGAQMRVCSLLEASGMICLSVGAEARPV